MRPNPFNQKRVVTSSVFESTEQRFGVMKSHLAVQGRVGRHLAIVHAVHDGPAFMRGQGSLTGHHSAGGGVTEQFRRPGSPQRYLDL